MNLGSPPIISWKGHRQKIGNCNIFLFSYNIIISSVRKTAQWYGEHHLYVQGSHHQWHPKHCQMAKCSTGDLIIASGSWNIL